MVLKKRRWGVSLDRRVNKGLLLERNQLQPRLSEKLICGRKQRGNTNLFSLAKAVVGHGWLSFSSSSFSFCALVVSFHFLSPPSSPRGEKKSVVVRSLLLLSAIRVGSGGGSKNGIGLFFHFLLFSLLLFIAGRFPLFPLSSLFRHIFESSSLLRSIAMVVVVDDEMAKKLPFSPLSLPLLTPSSHPSSEKKIHRFFWVGGGGWLCRF